MRFREDFAKQRKTEIFDYKPKFIIVSEGSCSEPRYFGELNKSLLSDNVTIINLLRDFATKTNSHPTFIILIFKEILLNIFENKITLNEIKNKIKNCIREKSYNIDFNLIEENIRSVYGNDDNYQLDFSQVQELLFEIFKTEMYKDIAVNFADYFDAQNITYSPENDSLNMVIDRDKNNFFDNQYDDVKNFCLNNKVNLYISNPCFEFWLMLHFDEVDSEDKQKMFENAKVNSSRRYLEQKLHGICKYTKKHFAFANFEDKIDRAIAREKEYAENIDDLKNNLGSNVGILVEKMIKKEND